MRIRPASVIFDSMHKITSRQNQHVKDAVKLRERRQRDKQRRFLIEGVRELSRAIDQEVAPHEVFVCEQHCDSPEHARLLERLAATSAELLYVTPEVYEKLSFGDRQEGVLAVAETPSRSLDTLDLPEQSLIGVIEGVEKPGNLGAILRTADGAGLDALIVCGGTDLYNPSAVRASLGTVFSRSICSADSSETLNWLRARKIPIFATRVDAQAVYANVDLSRGGAIVLGSEAAGLSEIWHVEEVTPIRVPMLGIADSLNVSATAAVLFYEARRQRLTSNN